MWWDERMLAFDLETTAPDPQDARIVSAALAVVGGGLATETFAVLCNPGIEIPAEATEVHGITNERVQAEGHPPREVLAAVLALLEAHEGLPLIVFNARYDLTVLTREIERHGIRTDWQVKYTVDPFVCDKWLDRYRKGSRKLVDACKHYGAKLDGAHDAAFDAIAAARLAYVIGKRGQVIRRVRNAQEGREKAMLVREWEGVRGNLELLTLAQRRWALAERDRFAAYKREQGEEDEAEQIESEIGWPVLDALERATPA